MCSQAAGGPTSAKNLLEPALTPGAQPKLHADLNPELIAKSGCLHLPDPGLHHGPGCEPTAQSLLASGITHTLCSHNVMQSLEQLVTAPLEPWDALVCTSRSAMRVVQEAMSCMHELERRFRQTLSSLPGPQLPRSRWALIRSLPLAREIRKSPRAKAGHDNGGALTRARVVLFLGRLSFLCRFTALWNVSL